MAGNECIEIIISAVDAAGLVYFQVLSNPPFCIAHFSGKVDVFCREYVVINQAVDGAFADSDGIPVCCADMVYGLPLHDEGGK